MYKMCFIGRLLILFFLILIVTTFTKCSEHNKRLKEIFNWKQINYEFESDMKRKNMIETGQFIIGNCIPTSIGIWTDKLFFVLPRFKLGVLASLAYIHINSTDPAENMTSPTLKPYPNLESHELQSKNITSIINIYIDSCDRLWAIDSGQIENKMETIPEIQIYDLKINQRIESYKLKSKNEYKIEPYLSDIVVDVTSSNCDNAWAYIADANNYELIVYNMKAQDSYRIRHNFFHFDPLFGDFNIDNIHYQSQHGIFSLAMSPVGRDDHRTLYFSALGSSNEFVVSTKILQNNSLDSDNNNIVYEFKIMGSRGPSSQSSASVLDEETGVLFYTLISKNAIACWNSFSGDEYNDKTQGILATDETMIYPSDVITDKNGMIWVLSNRFPRFMYGSGSFNTEEINFRLFRAPIRKIIKGTVCDSM